MATQPFSFVITPNIDFVVRAHVEPATRELFDEAALQICDSRVLQLTMRLFGLRLSWVPGSDLVHLLVRQDSQSFRIAVIGPNDERLERLRATFPASRIGLIRSPARFNPGDPAWRNCVTAAAVESWDILLICLGSPKQEQFAVDLGRLRRDPGVALCVGASIDFLTGAQKRAPRWVSKVGMEWLYRLLNNPRRMLGRYMLAAPRFFWLVLTNRGIMPPD